MALEQLQKNLGQLGALAAIALAMGERLRRAGPGDRGDGPGPAGGPARRSSRRSSLAIAAVLGVATLLASAVAWIYTAILFEPLPVGGWLAMAALSWLAPDVVGGPDVPRVGGDGLHDGGGRDRVRGPDRVQPRRDRAGRGPVPADRADDPGHGARRGEDGRPRRRAPRDGGGRVAGARGRMPRQRRWPPSGAGSCDAARESETAPSRAPFGGVAGGRRSPAGRQARAWRSRRRWKRSTWPAVSMMFCLPV